MKKNLLTVGVLAAFAFTANAYDFKEDGIAYNKLSDSTVEVTFLGADYNSGKDYTDKNYVIPATVVHDGTTYTVVKIGDSAFYGSSVEAVTLPQTVTVIDNYAFGNCRSMKSINLPKGITSIPKYALTTGSSSKMETLTIDCDPTLVNADIFTNSSSYFETLQTLIIGPELESISSRAFDQWCSFAPNLVIAKSENTLTIEGNDYPRFIFGNLTVNRPVVATLPSEAKWLENIHIGNIAPFSSLTFVPENYSKATLYVNGKHLDAYKSAEPWNSFKTIEVEPGTEPDNNYGFNLQLLKTDNEAYILPAYDDVPPYEGDIVIPDYIIYSGARFDIVGIEGDAFRGTDITSVKFGSKIRRIGQAAFQNCPNLAKVELNEGLREIGMDAFSNTPLLEEITIPGSISDIPYNAFGASGIRRLELKSGVKTIDMSFNGCENLMEVILPNTLEGLEGTFEGCTSLHRIDLPESLRYIGAFTFADTAIESLVIPEGITELEMQSLGCMNGDYNADYTLKSVTLPASLEKLNYKTFNNRRGIEELVINGTTPLNTDSRVFSATTGECPLNKLTLNRTLVQNGNDITSAVFNQKTGMEEVIFGESLSQVPDLSNCTALKSITVNNATAPAAGGFADAVYETAILHIPAEAENSYKTHEVWGKFRNIDLPAKPTTLDVAKIKYNVGEGDYNYAFVLVNGNDRRLDNLVWGVASDRADLSAAEAMALIAENDKRVKLDKEGDDIKAIYFDLNGDGEFDAKDTGFDSEWSEGADLLASDGTTRVLSMTHAEASADDVAYYFYLPTPEEEGIWLPESMTVCLSDNRPVLPVLVQVPDGKLNSTTNWQASSSNEKYLPDRTIIVTPYTLTDDTYNTIPTFTGATGTTYVRYRPQKYGEYAYYESNFMALTVEAPEVPMTAIHCVSDEISAGLNKNVEFEYTFEPENATYTAVTATVGDTSLASYSATAGLTTKQTEGTTTVTLASAYDANVKADFTLNVALQNPVTNVHFGHGTEDGVINVYVKQLIGLKPIVEPADADITDVDITLLDNGTSKDNFTCSTYKVNWWDINNVRSQFYELSGHRPTGDNPARLHVVSKDGRFDKYFTINVLESDRTPLENGYMDGTIILNEEWFGHTNGGLNYLTEDDEVIYQAYERENPGESFGCTSQYGTIWNDKLFVVSKQPADGGDVLPGGGCLVIADAKTLKKIGGSYAKPTWNGITGDGRAVAGATPDKIYVTTSNGIYIYDISDVENPVITGRIGNEDSQDLYSGQVGDIINGGKYVYAVMQAGGLMCINPETDEVTPITDPKVQGVTQTADGTVWYVTADGTGAEAHSVFVALDPETLEEIDRVHMPASIGMVQCGWGAWRSTAFKGDHTTGDLWFVTGAAGIMGGATGDYYRYTPGTDPSSIEPFFTLNDVTGINDFGEEVGQMTYGTPAFDARNNRLVVMTGRKGAASGGYRDHWIHFVDGTSKEITKTIKLNAYYWFQSLPIFPDKYDAVIDIDDLGLDKKDGDKVIDLTELVTDKDNIDANIKLSIEPSPVMYDLEADEESHSEATLVGKTLTIKPLTVGTDFYTLTAESNGKVVSKTLAVKVSDIGTGADSISGEYGSVVCDGKRLFINGFAGETFYLYDVAGSMVNAFEADDDNFVFDFGNHKGVYLLSNGKNFSTKVIIK